MNSKEEEKELEGVRSDLSIPTITFNYCSSDSDETIPNKDLPPLSDSSTNTSLCSSSEENELPKNDEDLSSCGDFMKTHVHNLFSSNVDISNSDKQTFGNLCQTPEGREAFAKYVDNYRCCSMEVSESTFYKLAHSFALVLFECAEADDFIPSKILMNMAFTYYHYPEGVSVQFKYSPDRSIELKCPNLKEFTVELSGSDGESEDNLSQKNVSVISNSKHVIEEANEESIWKTANNWFSQAAKDLTAYKPFNKNTKVNKQKKNKNVGVKENNHKIRANSCKGSPTKQPLNHDVTRTKQRRFFSTPNFNSFPTPDVSEKKRMYLYEVLRRQTIWQSLRFWNAAFFDAVNVERQNHCSKLKWNSLTPAEQESANETIRNVTFGQLGTFINNMKHLGIGQETCLQFLRKQSVIGNLNKDLYQIVRSQIEQPLNIDS